jgi:hypothetical protein
MYPGAFGDCCMQSWPWLPCPSACMQLSSFSPSICVATAVHSTVVHSTVVNRREGCSDTRKALALKPAPSRYVACEVRMHSSTRPNLLQVVYDTYMNV